MKIGPEFFLVLLMSTHAIAGAQYSAEDVIRYFEQLNAAAAAADPEADQGAAEGRGIGVGAPQPLGREGIVIGNAPAGERPLVIPMTGVRAGYKVAPVTPAALRTNGYDLMVTFELDSARLTPQARENLDAFVRALLSPALAKLRFAVEGHTDSSGSREHNLELSEARAASVVSYLVAHGITPDRLTAAGYGEARPRLNDPAHPDNRRVETRRIE